METNSYFPLKLNRYHIKHREFSDIICGRCIPGRHICVYKFFMWIFDNIVFQMIVSRFEGSCHSVIPWIQDEKNSIVVFHTIIDFYDIEGNRFICCREFRAQMIYSTNEAIWRELTSLIPQSLDMFVTKKEFLTVADSISNNQISM